MSRCLQRPYPLSGGLSVQFFKDNGEPETEENISFSRIRPIPEDDSGVVPLRDRICGKPRCASKTTSMHQQWLELSAPHSLNMSFCCCCIERLGVAVLQATQWNA